MKFRLSRQKLPGMTGSYDLSCAIFGCSELKSASAQGSGEDLQRKEYNIFRLSIQEVVLLALAVIDHATFCHDAVHGCV
jgi:hypothetical protein